MVTDQSSPARTSKETPLPERYDIASISCGREQTLALLDNGKVLGWGGDGSGRIPATSADYCSSPVANAGAVEVTTQHWLVVVAAGDGISLGLTKEQRVVIWGATAAGIGGRRESVVPATPQLLAGIENARAIAASEFSCGAIDASGKLYTWGLNCDGALGRPASNLNALPGLVTSLPPVGRLAAGKGYMLALTTSGELCGWGNNAAGQLGLGHLRSAATPQRLASKINIGSITAGATHALALTIEGNVWAWGSNHHGQLGQKSPPYSALPLKVELPERVRSVAAGMHFSLAQGDSGRVYAWGWNAKGQLGLGDIEDRYFASRIPGLDYVEAITAGETHAVALKGHGLMGWGDNESAQLGRANRLQVRPVQFFPAS